MTTLQVTIDGDLNRLMADEVQAGKRAVSTAMRAAASSLKATWRDEVRAAGLGSRLSNAVRAEVFPRGKVSLNGAFQVYTKAPWIFSAHESGATIMASGGGWLAIPTETAGRGRSGKRITPGEWEQRTGLKLRFVYRRGRSGLLVADGARINKRGLAKRKGGTRRKDGILTGETTAIVFILVRQVKLPKRLNLFVSSAAVHAGLPAAIVAAWRVPS